MTVRQACTTLLLAGMALTACTKSDRPSGTPSDSRAGDLTLYAPDTGKTIVRHDADLGHDNHPPPHALGQSNDYYSMNLDPADSVNTKGDCHMVQFARSMFDRLFADGSPDKYYFESTLRGTDTNHAPCRLYHYYREVDPRDLLALVGESLESAGVAELYSHGLPVMIISKSTTTTDDPVLVRIGQATLELTVTEAPRILVRLVEVAAPTAPATSSLH